MRYKQILSWGKRWHYPFLILDSNDHIQHGEEHYQTLRGDPRRQDKATLRIARWNELAGQPVPSRQKKVSAKSA